MTVVIMDNLEGANGSPTSYYIKYLFILSPLREIRGTVS